MRKPRRYDLIPFWVIVAVGIIGIPAACLIWGR